MKWHELELTLLKCKWNYFTGEGDDFHSLVLGDVVIADGDLLVRKLQTAFLVAAKQYTS